MPSIIESECVVINLEEVRGIPETERILLVGRDLKARARLEGVEGLGGRVDAVSPGSLPTDPGAYSLAVLDLDEVGTEPAQALRDAGFEGRIVGFFSHVDETLRRRAEGAGIETHRRGSFWRDLPEILAGNAPD